MPEGLRAILVGEAEAVRDADNHFRFDEVYPGEHTLYVYGERGPVEVSEFTTDTASAFIGLEVMIDLCIGTELTPVRGTVIDGNGSPIARAVVSVADLFIETITDKNGSYELKLPPGEWTINAANGAKTTREDVLISKPDVDWDVPALIMNFNMD